MNKIGRNIEGHGRDLRHIPETVERICSVYCGAQPAWT